MLSAITNVSAVADLNEIGSDPSAVGPAAAGPSSTTSNSIYSTNGQGISAADLQADLAASVADRDTLATVVAGPSTTSNNIASSNAPNPHIYTGQTPDLGGTLPTTGLTPGQVSTPNPGQYNPSQPSQAALAALAKSIDAQPQFLILPSAAQGASPDAGEGPGGGYTPQQFQGAYGTSQIQFGSVKGDGAGQTIALIDAYGNPDFLSTSDPNYNSSALAIFDQYFGLPDPPSFQIYDQYGNAGGTGEADPGWGLEIALDVEWAHAMAPAANIDLVEGYTSSLDDLLTANVTAANQLGADVISNSWGYFLEGSGEGYLEPYLDDTYLAPALATNPNVTFLASSGDSGANYGVLYPSISPYMVGAGGTSLDATGNTWTGEYSWNYGGGGISTEYSAPGYQSINITGYSQRTSPDISSDANLDTGVSVYDPYFYGGWIVVGGTSVSSPTLAGEFGIADQGRTLLGGLPLSGPQQTLPALYSGVDYLNNYHDITEDYNGQGNNGYPTGVGYDLDTGIGSPRADGLIPYLALYDLGPAVVSSVPATGQVVTGLTPPDSFTLTFSEPVDPNSVVAGDFTVDGIPADSDWLSPDDTSITYTFDTSPVTQQGPQSMYLPADSVVGEYDGQPNHAAFSGQFYYVVTQLQVSATSPAVGSVLTIPVTDLVVQFNEAIDPYAITTADFQLSQGSVISAVPLTPSSVDLTLSGVTQDGTLTLTVPAGVLLDRFGVPNLAFTGTYITDIVSQPYPVPLQGQAPAGSLIYDPSVTGSVGFAGDTDTYTLALAAGQTLTMVMSTDPNLIGTVTLEDPLGHVIATATAGGPGDDAVLQTAPINTAGTYSLIVGGAGGTTGNYTMQAILNAAFKQATDGNNTIGTAYDLGGAFASLGTAVYSDRAGVVGTLGGNPTDYYGIHLTAGESMTVAAKGNGGTADVAIYDGSGNLLALSGGSGGGVDSVISDFVAPYGGTFYAQVTGTPGLQYDLVVTRNADFTLHGYSFGTAQPLNGVDTVLGGLVSGAPALQALDDISGSYSNIYATDPTTGAFGSSILSPIPAGFYLFGQNMASDGQFTYYNDGYGGSGTIYKLNSSGDVVASFTPPDGDIYTGLAYLDGMLYATNPFDASIDIYDASTFAFVTTLQTGITDSVLVGLAGDPSTGTLYAVGQVSLGSGELYQIDPSTGAVLQEAADNNSDLYEQDMAYADGMLIVSEVLTSGGFLAEYNPADLSYLQTVSPPYAGDASGLAGDGLSGGNGDWYQFNANAGDNLAITTTTPGDTSGNGDQFYNGLIPTLNLYDADGNLVATATGNASDGINDVIDWTALSAGNYRVQIVGSSATNLGEYTITIQGATGALAPFQVTSSDPAAGSDIGYQVSSMTVTFSGSVLLSSATPSDFTIDGNTATGVIPVSSNTVEFTFPTTSNGVHDVSISGVEDLQGTVMSPDSFTFQTDDVAPVVVSSSIADGAVLAPGPLTEVITFSEPIQPSSVSTSDISLYGEIRGISYSPTFSFDPTDTILTITYADLPTDAYQFALDAGPSNFLSDAGVPLQNSFVINFTILGGTSTISGLQPVLPLGSLIYQGTYNNLLISSSDVDTYSLAIDPDQTLAVVAKPVSSGMSVTVTLISPTGNVIGTATSPTAGAPAVLPGVQSSKGGTYTIEITGGPGEYALTPTLNAYLDPAAYGGTPNASIATATPIDPYANKIAGNDTRTAVIGGLGGGGGGAGGLVSTDRYTQALYSVDASTGAATLIGGLTYYTSFSGMAIDPSGGTTYISDVYDPSAGLWSLGTIDRTSGAETIIGPQYNTSTGGYDSDVHALVEDDGTLYGFSLDAGLVIFNTSNGSFTPVLPFDSMPEPIENAAIDASSGTIYGVGENSGDIYTIDLSTASATFIGNPETGNFDLIGLAFTGGSLYELGYNGGSSDTPLWQIDPTTVVGTAIGPNGMEYQPDAMTAPSASGGGGGETSATYSFALNQGESVTIALEALSGQGLAFSLYDDQGDLLAMSSPGATNYTAGLNNFVAPNDGTYYVQITGKPGSKFDLVVTRGADFATQPNNTPATAQDITATQQSGDNKLGGALGSLQNPNGAILGTTIEGIDFNGSNCGCLPPDTNAAVGNGFVAETVNVQFRVWDTAGNELLDEPLSTLFGQSTAGDPYVLYDALAGHWYVTGIDGTDNSKELLAISTDANPLDGFSNVYEVPVAASGDFTDFAKPGYNASAIVIEANDFGDGHSVVTAVDKAQAIAGNLVYYESTPSYNFRALVPAQMTDDTSGTTMWFMASTGDPNYAGTTPNTIRVTEMTDILSNSPVYTDFTVPIGITYGGTTNADQPGAPGSVTTNDVTATSVDYLDGMMVTAFPATTAADGFKYTKSVWVEVDVSGGTPELVQAGVVDPGAGVSAFFPGAAIDPNGDIGISFMESSSTEYVSAAVAGHIAGMPLGSTTAGVVFAPGGGSMPYSDREGDYGSAVYDPGTGLFWGANEYIGSDGSSNIWRTSISSFSLLSAIGTDYYSVDANAGDNLHFATTTPAGGPNEFINGLYPELLLYDPNGSLVAIAAGNAADGRNSVIDFTVPSGDAGSWIIEVTASPDTPSPTDGEYGLLVTGATGALAPFTVTGVNPPPGALIQPPSTITVTFNEPVLITSLTAGELEVNGVPADSYTVVSGNTVSWTVDPASFGTGVDLANVVTLGADAYGDQIVDVSGQTLIPFSYTFFTTNVAPYVVSSSIDGMNFSPEPADVTEVVTFSQPMNTSFTTSSSFELMGNYRNVQYAAASFSWDPTGTILTINYNNLPDDTYTLTLFAGGFESAVGIPLASDYVANFTVSVGTAAFGGSFTPVLPMGSLIYTGTDSHVLATPTDVDYLTLTLNAGETLTLIATPTTSSLQLELAILDPNLNEVASTMASAPGSAAVIETATIATTGTYTIAISDLNGNLGLYSIQAYLDSYVKQGASNTTIATADDITGSSYDLTPGGSDRLGVVGSLPDNVLGVGDVFVSSRYYGYYYPAQTTTDILRVNSAGDVVQVIPVFGDPYLSLAGVELDPANNMLYAAVTTSFNSDSVDGELLEFNPSTGQQVAAIPLPTDEVDYGYYYPYGFSIAPDGSFWIPQPNSGNIIHLDASYNEVGSYSAGGFMPESASIGTDGDVYFSTTVGNVYQLVPSSGAVNYFASTASPFGTLTNTAPNGSGIWSADFYDGALRYDYSGNPLQQVGYPGTNQAQTDENGDVWTTNLDYFELFQFDPYGDELAGTFVPAPIGLTIWGVDNPNAPPQDTQDYYSFSLSKGQTATIVADSLNGDNLQITLVDGKGDVLASGVGGATNVTEDIENFVATYSGTYYVEITGPGAQYSLVVTRGSDFSLQPHNSSSTAQDLTGTGGALGYLAPPSAPLFTLDDQEGEFGNPLNPIWATDPTTGDFIGSPIYAPGSPANNPFGQNLAYDGTYLYYDNGAEFGDNTIYKIDPTTGDVISSGIPAGVPLLTGLAYLDGELYGMTAADSTLYVIDPNSFQVVNTITTGIGPDIFVEGLAGDPDLGVLFAVSQAAFEPSSLYEIDPTTGDVINSAPDQSQGAYEQDLAYANGQLIVSDTTGFGPGFNFLDSYDPNTLAFIQRLPVATEGFVAGLGGDGLGGAPKDDWYSIDVQAGQALYLQTSTPSDQGGEFPNTASLEISLYDTYGNLIAVGTKLPDGRNEALFFNAPVSGQYTIEISEDPGGAGEYYLSVNTASYPSGGATGEVYNDLDGSGTLLPGDPGLSGWEVDLYDSNDNFVASQLTDANGDFSFQGLDPGTYTVVEDVQAGWTQTAPPTYTFTIAVTAGSTISGLDFGNFQDITISGQAYNDLNGNGTEDPGEPGLPGLTVDLLDPNGDLLATTTTDVNGNYSFADLGPGTYTVEEEVPIGTILTQPAPPGTYTVAVTSGQDATGLLFGNFQLVTYAGTVYDDLNGNGVDDPGDPGLQGWTVDLLDSNGNIVATTISASDGSYSFADLGYGVYTIEEIDQPGWYQTEPQQPFSYTVTATSGASQADLNFGNFQLVNVTGEVYNDLNDNGNLDPGEPGLQGWTVNLFNAAGNLVATTTSDANGDYTFDDLFPGTFTVSEVPMSGWTQTQPVDPGYYSFSTQSGLDETGLNFGNFSEATFSGVVYNDLSGIGSPTPSDPVLANWTIELLNSDGGIVATTTSNARGKYTFTDVGAGVYTIEEVVMPGWVITEPTNPPGTYTVTATSGATVSGLNFGNYKTVTVSGTTYNDLNGNGLRGGGEPGLSGWTVDLEDSSGNVLAAATTDSNGNYSFSGVPGGTYEVAEVVPTNWVQTQPGYPTVYTFTSQSGHNLTALVFGDHASPALDPSAVIGNGQPGYAETGSWSTAVGGFNGTNRVAQNTTGTQPTATASWTFNGLPVGSYEVYITYAGKGTYSTAAPFSVQDGGTSLSTVDVNESILVTQSHGGLAQGSYGGVGWLELGAYAINSGTLEVLLSNAASGHMVDANGVLIIPETSSQGLSPKPGVVVGGPIGLGANPAVATPSPSSTPPSTANAKPATVAIGGVSTPASVHVVYNQGAAAGGNPAPASLIDAALSQIDSDGTGPRKSKLTS